MPEKNLDPVYTGLVSKLRVAAVGVAGDAEQRITLAPADDDGGVVVGIAEIETHGSDGRDLEDEPSIEREIRIEKIAGAIYGFNTRSHEGRVDLIDAFDGDEGAGAFVPLDIGEEGLTDRIGFAGSPGSDQKPEVSTVHQTVPIEIGATEPPLLAATAGPPGSDQQPEITAVDDAVVVDVRETLGNAGLGGRVEERSVGE